MQNDKAEDFDFHDQARRLKEAEIRKLNADAELVEAQAAVNRENAKLQSKQVEQQANLLRLQTVQIDAEIAERLAKLAVPKEQDPSLQ